MGDQQLYNYSRIAEAIRYMSENFRAQPDLPCLAEKVNMSSFHFQRIFTEWVGLSPKKFLQYLTIDFLREKIHETETMMEAAEISGLSSQSRVHDLFVKVEGVSPQQFKTGGKSLEIVYGYHATPFGMCFIAVAEKGICRLAFIDEEKRRDEFSLFSKRWPFAKLVHKPEFTQQFVRRIFAENRQTHDKLQVLVQGTEFQIKVWESLLQIPYGQVCSFEMLANMVGHPNAVRPVASAVAQNAITYLIPCHRIISKNGTMGNYHYGKVRKQAMIGWEISKATDR